MSESIVLKEEKLTIKEVISVCGKSRKTAILTIAKTQHKCSLQTRDKKLYCNFENLTGLLFTSETLKKIKSIEFPAESSVKIFELKKK